MTNQTIYSHSFVSTPTGSANGSGLTLDVVINYNSKSQWNAQWSIRTLGDGYEIGEPLTIARPVGVFSSAAHKANNAPAELPPNLQFLNLSYPHFSIIDL